MSEAGRTMRAEMPDVDDSASVTSMPWRLDSRPTTFRPSTLVGVASKAANSEMRWFAAASSSGVMPMPSSEMTST